MILLDKDNCMNYVEMPDYILEKFKHNESQSLIFQMHLDFNCFILMVVYGLMRHYLL